MLRIASSSRHHPSRQRRQPKLPLGAVRLLAAFEGIEGGFAIGSSIVVALSFASLDRSILLTTALVSIIVSGFNSSIVKYSSEHYLDELDGHEKKSPIKHYLVPANIEFVCYVAISLLTVAPLLYVSNLTLAVVICVVVTIILLFLAGLWRGYILRAHAVRDAIETALLGIAIILVGVVSGWAIHSL